MNGWSWFTLHSFLNLLKQATIRFSEPRAAYTLLHGPGVALAAASLDSQFGFAYKSQSPEQVAAISDCFIAQAGYPEKKTGER